MDCEPIPSVVGQMFGRYPYKGFPILSDKLNVNSIDLHEQLLNNLYQLNVPRDVGLLIFQYSNIISFQAILYSKSFDVCFNMDCNTKKPFVWVFFKGKWYKYYLQQCSVRYNQFIASENYDHFWLRMECQNLVLHPQHTNHSIYNKKKYGCCISYIKNDKRYCIEGDHFNCRACFDCIDRFWNQRNYNLFHWDSQECTLERGIYGDLGSDVYGGNTKLFKFFTEMGMDLKYDHLTRKNGKITFTKPNKLYCSRLKHKRKISYNNN